MSLLLHQGLFCIILLYSLDVTVLELKSPYVSLRYKIKNTLYMLGQINLNVSARGCIAFFAMMSNHH